jgi:hypothetical protein
MPFAGPPPGAWVARARPRPRAALLAALAAVLVLGLGAGGWMAAAALTGPGRPRPQAAGPRPTAPSAQAASPATSAAGIAGAVGGTPEATGTGAVAGSPAVTAPAVTSSPPTVTLSPPAVTLSPSGVAVAAAAAASPQATGVAAFLGQYFDAINRHDYAAYTALEGPREQGMSRAQFDSGYDSTSDSAQTLLGIAVAGNGDLIAQVSFTSRQQPGQSITGTSCTDWTISLYLLPAGQGFLIDSPPSSYHAAYAACP